MTLNIRDWAQFSKDEGVFKVSTMHEYFTCVYSSHHHQQQLTVFRKMCAEQHIPDCGFVHVHNLHKDTTMLQLWETITATWYELGCSGFYSVHTLC